MLLHTVRAPAVSQRAFGAGLAVLLSMLALQTRHDAPPPDVAAAKGTEHESTTVPAEGAAAPSAPSNFTPAVAAEASLMAAFQSAGNLRVFMHEAMRHPQRGGVFYALRALTECRRQQGTQFESEADPSPALGHAELVARAIWAELSLRGCAAFTADDLADGEVQRRFELGAARGAGGPLDDVARRRRMDAWALLPCEFGADCARPDLGAASPCVGAGRCEGGQRAHVIERGGWQTEAERAALAAEFQALRAAVMARDAWAALGLVKP